MTFLLHLKKSIKKTDKVPKSFTHTKTHLCNAPILMLMIVPFGMGKPQRISSFFASLMIVGTGGYNLGKTTYRTP